MMRPTHARAPRLGTLNLSALALALGLSFSAPAQTSQGDEGNKVTADNNKPRTLQTIQVHGQAEPTYGDSGVARHTRLGVLGDQDVMDTPFSTTSYTSEYIQAIQAQTIGQALAQDPSVRVTSGYGNFAEMFVIRGFPLNGDDVAFDGLYGVMPRQIVAAETIGRLDVLRGASAFLYGISATGSGIGGTINIEPKWATDAPITRLTTDYTSNSMFGGNVDVGRRFGEDNRYGIRVNLGDRGGNSSVQDEYHRSNYQSIAFDIRGDRFRFNANVAHQRQQIDDGRSVVYVSTVVPSPPRASANYSERWASSSLEDTYGVARAEYDITRRMTAYAAVGFDHSNENGEYVSPSITDAAGNGSFYRLGVPYQNDSVSGEAGLNGAFDTGAVSHKFNVGVSAMNTRKTVGYDFGYLPGFQSVPTNLYDMTQVDFLPSQLSSSPGITGRTKLRSLALSDTLGFWNDQVLLTLGVRRQKLQVYGYNYPASGGNMISAYNKSANSPVAGLVVKLGSEWSLFGNSIQALTQGPTPDSQAINANAVFAPGHAKQLEAGVKYDHGSVGSTFSVFQIKQPTGITDPVTRVFSVAGEQRNRGAEWTVYGDPIEGLHLLGGVTVIDPTLVKTDDDATQGNAAIGVSKWQYNAGARWTIPGAKGLSLDAEVVRSGPQYVNLTNTLQIAPWTRVDVGAIWPTRIEGKDVTFRANVINVGNNNYWASAQAGYLVQSLPRTVKLSMSIDF
ncbi:MAG: TonB-dependent receptor [Dyella sp.]